MLIQRPPQPPRHKFRTRRAPTDRRPRPARPRGLRSQPRHVFGARHRLKNLLEVGVREPPTHSNEFYRRACLAVDLAAAEQRGEHADGVVDGGFVEDDYSRRQCVARLFVYRKTTGDEVWKTCTFKVRFGNVYACLEVAGDLAEEEVGCWCRHLLDGYVFLLS